MLLCVVLTLNAVPLTANAVGEDSLNEDPITQQPSQIPDEAATTVPNEGGWDSRIPTETETSNGGSGGNALPAAVPPYVITPVPGGGDSYSPVVATGVYRLKNTYTGLYLDVKDGNTHPGAEIQTWNGTGYENNRHMLFKFTYMGSTFDENDRDIYSIRTMVNSALGLWTPVNYDTDAPVSAETVPLQDNTSVFDELNSWKIQKVGDYYVIENGEAPYQGYLSTYTISNGAGVYVSESLDYTCYWSLEPYTGEAIDGVTFNNFQRTLREGNVHDYSACMYSSTRFVNGPPTYSVSEIGGAATDKATIDPNTGLLTTLKPGDVSVRVTYQNAPWIWCWTVTIQEPLEGTYYLRNGQHSFYMQIAYEGAPSMEGAFVEACPFSVIPFQQFELVWVNDIYYKIVCVASNLALTVTNAEYGIITQATCTGSPTQQWSITDTEGGLSKITPRSNQTLYLSMFPDATQLLNGVSLRGDDPTNCDEWMFLKTTSTCYTDLEGQQKSLWCWAASARMFAKESYPSVIYLQEEAVIYVKGSCVNATGNRVEAQRAINYYISNVGGASIDTVISEYEIYSLEALMRFLNDGHVLYISRGWYSDITTTSSRYGGHATLIYGYVTTNLGIRFLVRDPGPVGVGSSYMISYEKLCNGRNDQSDELPDDGVWYASIVVNTAYSDETIPYYFDSLN